MMHTVRLVRRRSVADVWSFAVRNKTSVAYLPQRIHTDFKVAAKHYPSAELDEALHYLADKNYHSTVLSAIEHIVAKHSTVSRSLQQQAILSAGYCQQIDRVLDLYRKCNPDMKLQESDLNILIHSFVTADRLRNAYYTLYQWFSHSRESYREKNADSWQTLKGQLYRNGYSHIRRIVRHEKLAKKNPNVETAEQLEIHFLSQVDTLSLPDQPFRWDSIPCDKMIPLSAWATLARGQAHRGAASKILQVVQLVNTMHTPSLDASVDLEAFAAAIEDRGALLTAYSDDILVRMIHFYAIQAILNQRTTHRPLDTFDSLQASREQPLKLTMDTFSQFSIPRDLLMEVTLLTIENRARELVDLLYAELPRLLEKQCPHYAALVLTQSLPLLCSIRQEHAAIELLDKISEQAGKGGRGAERLAASKAAVYIEVMSSYLACGDLISAAKVCERAQRIPLSSELYHTMARVLTAQHDTAGLVMLADKYQAVLAGRLP